MEMGSGTIVAVDSEWQRALVLTCRHVLPDDPAPKRNLSLSVVMSPAQLAAGDRIEVILPDGRKFTASWLMADERADLAACVIPATESLPCAPVADRQPDPGEAVWQVGYPGGVGPKARSGVARGLNGWIQTGAPVWGLNLWCAPGDSGSGIFRPSDGALVGVLWGGTQGKPDTAANCLADVRRFLQRCFQWVRPGQGKGKGPTSPGPGKPSEPLPGTPSVEDSRIAESARRLDAIEKAIAGWKDTHAAIDKDLATERTGRLANAGRIDSAESVIGRIRNDLDAAKQIGGAHADRIGQAEAGLGKLAEELAKAHQVGDLLTGKLGSIHDKLAPLEAAVSAKLPAVEATLGTVTSAFPWLAFGAASGGAIPVLALASWGVSALIRRRSGKVGNVTSIPAAPAASGMDLGTLIASLRKVASQDQPAQPVQSPAPQQQQPPLPPQTVVHTEHEFVTVQDESRARAFEEALKQAAVNYPGAAPLVKWIEDVAKQVQSGQSKKG